VSPVNNGLVGVAQARDVEFIANNPGDWMIHCHMFHHMMNHMSSMVGPMAGHTMKMPGARDMANSMGMLSLGRGSSPLEELGPTPSGRGTGEQTTTDRAVRNRPGNGGHDQE